MLLVCGLVRWRWRPDDERNLGQFCVISSTRINIYLSFNSIIDIEKRSEYHFTTPQNSKCLRHARSCRCQQLSQL